MLEQENKPMCFRCMSFNTRWVFKPNSWKCNDCDYCTDGFDYPSEFDSLKDDDLINLELSELSKSLIVEDNLDI